MKRYYAIGDYEESETGDFVHYDDVEQLIAQHAQMLEALKVAISYHVRTYQEGQDDDEMIVYMALHAAIAAAEGGKA